MKAKGSQLIQKILECVCAWVGAWSIIISSGKTLWLRWKLRGKEVKADFVELLPLLQLKVQDLTADGFADNVGAKYKFKYFIFTHTFISENYKPSNVWLHHFSSKFFQSNDLTLSDAPHPKPCDICVSTSSVFTLKIQVLIPRCSDRFSIWSG